MQIEQSLFGYLEPADFSEVDEDTDDLLQKIDDLKEKMCYFLLIQVERHHSDLVQKFRKAVQGLVIRVSDFDEMNSEINTFLMKYAHKVYICVIVIFGNIDDVYYPEAVLRLDDGRQKDLDEVIRHTCKIFSNYKTANHSLRVLFPTGQVVKVFQLCYISTPREASASGITKRMASLRR